MQNIVPIFTDSLKANQETTRKSSQAKRQKIFRSEGKNVAMILRRERLFFLLAFSFPRKEKVIIIKE
jgi:hypothetical protein